MPLCKTSAIVLKSRKWGEADKIVTFFSLQYGKIRGVARGARRMKSRFGSALEPFVHCDLVLFEKHGDSLYRVSHADIRESFYVLRDKLETIGAAARLTNLAGAISADGDALPRMFDALLAGLRAIAHSSDPFQTAALFEVELLRFAGYLPHLERCTMCQCAQNGGAWYFSPRSGGIICTGCVRREPVKCPIVSPACLAYFRQVLKMDPAQLPRLKATRSVREELRDVIGLYIECVAGRRLPRSHMLVSFAAEGVPAYQQRGASLART
jgi:DNA repair protein RecO (recombination protein O)